MIKRNSKMKKTLPMLFIAVAVLMLLGVMPSEANVGLEVKI